MDWKQRGDETFTTVEVVPTSFVNEGSYVVAVGLLKEGVRILSWLNTERFINGLRCQQGGRSNGGW